ncbi:hypothetical protein FRC04_009135 [Tulasnella sp. 424]|nr:hypothetical protein FRC04_009135 [Tulasnella sp. 424]
MSVPNVTFPAFNGLNDDCETFVSSIQQLALSKEKHTDDKWIAGLVAGCLCGDALVWFAALDPTTQESWHSLRRRLLERYGIKALPRMSKNASPLKRHSRASSRSPDRDGVYYVTQNASEALHVQVEPAKDNQLMEIRLMNSSVTQEHLGVTWYNSGNPDMRYGSSSISGLSATRVTPLVVESSASELYRGPESSTIWSLGEGDALEAKWPTGSGHAHTLVMAIGPGNLVYFVPDQCSWIEGSWFGRYVEARLTFEPFIRPLAHSRNSSTSVGIKRSFFLSLLTQPPPASPYQAQQD